MLRVRFKANLGDYRPIKWPVKHPFWCTGYGGYGDNYSIVVSYADDIDYIMEHWPEARDLECDTVEAYEFSSRFPKPEWFQIS